MDRFGIFSSLFSFAKLNNLKKLEVDLRSNADWSIFVVSRGSYINEMNVTITCMPFIVSLIVSHLNMSPYFENASVYKSFYIVGV